MATSNDEHVTRDNFHAVRRYIEEAIGGKWPFSRGPAEDFQRIPTEMDPEGVAVTALERWVQRYLVARTKAAMFAELGRSVASGDSPGEESTVRLILSRQTWQILKSFPRLPDVPHPESPEGMVRTLLDGARRALSWESCNRLESLRLELGLVTLDQVVDHLFQVAVSSPSRGAGVVAPVELPAAIPSPAAVIPSAEPPLMTESSSFAALSTQSAMPALAKLPTLADLPGMSHSPTLSAPVVLPDVPTPADSPVLPEAPALPETPSLSEQTTLTEAPNLAEVPVLAEQCDRAGLPVLAELPALAEAGAPTGVSSRLGTPAPAKSRARTGVSTLAVPRTLAESLPPADAPSPVVGSSLPEVPVAKVAPPQRESALESLLRGAKSAPVGRRVRGGGEKASLKRALRQEIQALLGELREGLGKAA
ncbi:MAG: hypothetical protein HQL57_04165 [Magnetococcales bacterium]|nr:hypothetical protein [Magnetococcales bacterium]MBF0156358.1 hypothetical protein [Magnetococcales bacterium]